MSPVHFWETLEGEEAPLELEAGAKWPLLPPLIGPVRYSLFRVLLPYLIIFS